MSWDADRPGAWNQSSKVRSPSYPSIVSIPVGTERGCEAACKACHILSSTSKRCQKGPAHRASLSPIVDITSLQGSMDSAVSRRRSALAAGALRRLRAARKRRGQNLHTCPPSFIKSQSATANPNTIHLVKLKPQLPLTMSHPAVQPPQR